VFCALRSETGVVMASLHRWAELRADTDKRIIEGMVISWNDEARLYGQTRERIEQGAVRWNDVILNSQHDESRLLARTGGGGLAISENPNGIQMRAELPNTREADDVLELVKTRVLRGLSIEMVVERDKWNNRHRIITKARMTGIGVVARPAYGQSKVVARNNAKRRKGWL